MNKFLVLLLILGVLLGGCGSSTISPDSSSAAASSSVEAASPSPPKIGSSTVIEGDPDIIEKLTAATVGLTAYLAETLDPSDWGGAVDGAVSETDLSPALHLYVVNESAVDAAIAAYGKETFPHATDFSVAKQDRLIALIEETIPCLPGDRPTAFLWFDRDGAAEEQPTIAVIIASHTGQPRNDDGFHDYYIPVFEQFMRETDSKGRVVLRFPKAISQAVSSDTADPSTGGDPDVIKKIYQATLELRPIWRKPWTPPTGVEPRDDLFPRTTPHRPFMSTSSMSRPWTRQSPLTARKPIRSSSIRPIFPSQRRTS